MRIPQPSLVFCIITFALMFLSFGTPQLAEAQSDQANGPEEQQTYVRVFGN
jgi:hypothetical protein